MRKEENKKFLRLGKNQQKILVLLMGGIALGLSGNPKRYFKILGEIDEALKEIDRESIQKSIRSLYESKMIETKENKDGTLTIVLTEDGHKKALTFDLDNLKIKKPQKWDKKWRMVLFDVPEKKRSIRGALRHHFKNLGLYEYQKSVFIYPYNCKNQIDYIIELNEAREFVRFVIADHIDNELHIKNIFELNS